VETQETGRSPATSHQTQAANRAAPRQDRPAPVNAETPFSIEEVFFSRTNEKGHILYGNRSFQRIAQYSWDELFRKPHSIVRHPDMPRAVFWLLWDALEKGEPIGAYVKNMARDGRYYWVFAIATPVEGGYLSVRIKPSTPLLRIVEREYAALLAVETSKRLKPAESAKLLLARLNELGFRDYASFMAAALTEEMRARDGELKRSVDKAGAHFEAVGKEAVELLKLAEGVVADYTAHRYVPLNLRVQAAQLREAGATIAVIAMNYDELAATLKTMTTDFMALAQRLFATVNKGLFLRFTAKIQKEASEQFKDEGVDGDPPPAPEVALLEAQCGSYDKLSASGLRSIVTEAQRFGVLCLEMKRAASALDTARIMGKVESARLGGADTGLAGLLSELERYQASMGEGLQKMLVICQRIERDAARLL
jgi:PAS domain S-box-containing protein